MLWGLGPEHLGLVTPISLLFLGSLAAFHLLQQLALSDPPTHVGFVYAKYHLPLDREGRKNTAECFRLLSLICTGLRRCCVQEAQVPGLCTASAAAGPGHTVGPGPCSPVVPPVPLGPSPPWAATLTLPSQGRQLARTEDRGENNNKKIQRFAFSLLTSQERLGETQALPTHTV